MTLQRTIKRVMDAVLSALLLVALAPALALIAILVKATSPGPVLFPCDWVGKDGKPFRGYKFRSMVTGADELEASLQDQNEMTGPAFKLTNDPRVTPLGRTLRKYSLDELPQLWSVLKGDLSLVGPRPPRTHEFAQFTPFQHQKLTVKPGITCLWQVEGRHMISDYDEWVERDLDYIRRWSLWLDIQILARTAVVVVRGDGRMSRNLDVSVVILSYDRVHLLERTLTACLADRSADDLTWEIIVVDNHPARLAERLVTRLAQVASAPITYLSDARRNVSVVRNLGIAKARGRYVAFIDDDEAPEAGWLKELVATLDRTSADAAFGPKYPEFEGGAAPAWNRDGWRYTLDLQMQQDEQVHLFGRLRKKGKGLGSGNAAFRVATCFDTPEPFAVAFGDGNGEDTHLLFRLALAGKRFVWAPRARVLEFIEKDRAKPSYMVTRMKRGSQHYAASRIATSDRKLYTQARVTLLGLAQLCVHAGLYVASAEWLRRGSFDHRIGMAKGMGKLTWRAPIGFIDEKAA